MKGFVKGLVITVIIFAVVIFLAIVAVNMMNGGSVGDGVNSAKDVGTGIFDWILSMW